MPLVCFVNYVTNFGMKFFFIALAAFGLQSLHNPVHAQLNVQMELRPHCTDLDSDFDSALDAPAVGFMLDLNNDTCSRFSAKDPSTLQLQGLEAGERFDIDIIIGNPNEQAVTAAAANIAYDPAVIALSSITIDTDFFAESTPGGKVIDATTGTMNIVANTELNNSNTDAIIRLATFTVEVLNTGAESTQLDFSSIVEDETGVFTTENDTLTNILNAKPASLELVFETQAMSDSSSSAVSSTSSTGSSVSSQQQTSSSEVSSEPISSSSSSEAILKNIGEVCSSNNECLSENCSNGICGTAGTSVPNGGSCIVDFQCASFYCQDGICADMVDQSSSSVSSTDTAQSSNVAFSLLQVQNVRLTSDDTNVYLAWDTLNSSQVQGYTMYYGTVRSQYIQRKTVPKTETSLTIRDLPKGVQYFFSIKAVNSAGDETAFSPEVSVVIGNPNSSTSPLAANLSGINSNGESVLGETGFSSTVALGIIVLAVGTTLAFVRRRQAIHA